MRPYCIFIACLEIFTFCSLAGSEYRHGPDECCLFFPTVRISIKWIKSFYTTPPQCHRSGVIIITRSQKKICVDPTKRWVQRLMTSVKAQSKKIWAEIPPIHKMPVTSSKVDSTAKKAESEIMTESTPLLQPEETTLVLLKESHDWRDFDTTQANSNTEFAYFCKRPEGE